MERVAIVGAVRTPFVKAGNELAGMGADVLGALVIQEAVYRAGVSPHAIDSVIMGNVSQPAHAANIARVSALRAGLPQSIPAMTVHRNCASGMEAVTSAMTSIVCGMADVVVAGGTESMSNIPLMYGNEMTALFEQLFKAKTLGQRWRAIRSFRPRFLKPVVGLMAGLTDPISEMVMGQTAEWVSRDFGITRAMQDEYALASHQKACAAIQAGHLAAETMPVWVPPAQAKRIDTDWGPRPNQTLAALSTLPPFFNRKTGTVTVGNACPITDGAAAMVVMNAAKATAWGLPILGYIRGFAYAGLDPSRMGLGPVFATARVLDQTGLSMTDMDLIELNEAFAAQVLGNMAAFDSDQFAQTQLGRSARVGAIDPARLNVNGGAIALGHPVGTSGARIIMTLLYELKRRGLQRGLATLCVGGGQGGSVIVEVE